MVHLERSLHVCVEPDIQQWAIRTGPLTKVMSWMYINLHFVVTTVTLGFLYLRRNAHFYFSPGVPAGCAAVEIVSGKGSPSAQIAPSSKYSFFQMGTVLFSVSIIQRQASIDVLTTGGLVLRKRADVREGLFGSADAESGPTGPASDQIERLFAALDFDGDLGDERLRLAPHALDERLAWTDGAYRHAHLVARLDEGVGIEVPIDPAALPALFALDRSRPVKLARPREHYSGRADVDRADTITKRRSVASRVDARQARSPERCQPSDRCGPAR